MQPQPPRRIQKLFSESNPGDAEGLRALMAELAREGEAANQPDQGLIPRLRAAVQERVERTSLRGAAREIGMSPTGLKKFLDGNMPYTKTIHRLRNWYLRHAGDRRDDIGEEDAYAAFRVLVHDLPPGVQSQVIEAMLGCMEEGYQRTHRPSPAWIGELRRQYGLPR